MRILSREFQKPGFEKLGFAHRDYVCIHTALFDDAIGQDVLTSCSTTAQSDTRAFLSYPGRVSFFRKNFGPKPPSPSGPGQSLTNWYFRHGRHATFGSLPQALQQLATGVSGKTFVCNGPKVCDSSETASVQKFWADG